MKNKAAILLNMHIMAAACFAILILAISSCGSSRHSEKTTEIKNWINWKIEFKQGATEDEKTIAIIKIQQYIFDYINTEDPSHKIINSIDVSYKRYFFHNPDGKFILNVDINAGERSTRAVNGGPKPIIGPGRKDLEMMIKENIKIIENISTKEGKTNYQ